MIAGGLGRLHLKTPPYTPGCAGVGVGEEVVVGIDVGDVVGEEVVVGIDVGDVVGAVVGDGSAQLPSIREPINTVTKTRNKYFFKVLLLLFSGRNNY